MIRPVKGWATQKIQLHFMQMLKRCWRTFEEVEGYDDMVMLRNIRQKHCEHHMVLILGPGPYCLCRTAALSVFRNLPAF